MTKLSEDDGNLIRGASQFLFNQNEPRQTIYQLSNRLTSFSQQMQDEGHANQAIARKIEARINDAAIAFTANYGALFLHLFGNIDLADLRQKKRATKPANQLLKRGGSR